MRFGDLIIPGPVIRELSGHEASIERLKWCKDNRHFVTLDARYEVRVWSVDQTTPVFHVVLPPGAFFASNAAIALSHDARYLAYAGAGEEESPLRVIDTTTGAVVVEAKLPGGFEEMVASGNDSFLLVREEFDPGKQTLSTVLWDIVVRKRPARRHVVRPSAPDDVRRYFVSRLSVDGRYVAWNGPRLSNAGHRIEVREVATGRLVHLYRWEKKPMNYEGPDFVFGADATEFWLQDRDKSIDYRRIPLSGKGETRAATGFTETMSANGSGICCTSIMTDYRRDGRNRSRCSIERRSPALAELRQIVVRDAVFQWRSGAVQPGQSVSGCGEQNGHRHADAPTEPKTGDRRLREALEEFGEAVSDMRRLLDAANRGDHQAAADLLPLIYDELHKLAAARLAHEKPGQTLSATALVHEAYLRLVAPAADMPRFDGLGHFFAAAAEAIRRILVENVRRKRAAKHGGGLKSPKPALRPGRRSHA